MHRKCSRCGTRQCDRREILVGGPYRCTARRIAQAAASFAVGVLGTATPARPALALCRPQFDVGVSDVGYNASPTFADIDGDGDLDAFIGRYGGILFFENRETCSVCEAAPLGECAVPGKAVLKLEENADPAKRKFLWQWMKGTAERSNFGNPVTGTSALSLCVYDDDALKLEAGVAAQGTCGDQPCWQETSTGFKYKHKAGNSAGITQVVLREGEGNAKIAVKGKGANLSLPTLPLSQAAEVRVQLVIDPGTGPVCWESTFAPPAIENDTMQFKDKTPQ